ncbi:hypothetical protein [Levilactobacillus brevis]|uniref:hypothetical protein n=1 Tax=Levilactobacillus brevis TaxID=1580 RepID=UPI0005B64C79|nr:hypothetical protein [Levilactobacillus brevis]KIR08893.1 hypothetical protein RA16_05615 [Levilactobacillus brevis]MBT9676443.1 hypothetical protein [Levilactobacillus brevis]MBY7146624.1 hypothetical protein [Levilactobacillus brevis]MCP9615039.1 hypothetical protein [Levilactobacillus brevis]MCZ2119454.1 hypothetical protein [Levilactobacillus brevis]
MQETNCVIKTKEDHPIRAKVISGAVAVFMLLPLIITLIKFDWQKMNVVPLLIIVGMMVAIITGVWCLSQQLITVIREGGDSDFRER